MSGGVKSRRPCLSACLALLFSAAAGTEDATPCSLGMLPLRKQQLHLTMICDTQSQHHTGVNVNLDRRKREAHAHHVQFASCSVAFDCTAKAVVLSSCTSGKDSNLHGHEQMADKVVRCGYIKTAIMAYLSGTCSGVARGNRSSAATA